MLRPVLACIVLAAACAPAGPVAVSSGAPDGPSPAAAPPVASTAPTSPSPTPTSAGERPRLDDPVVTVKPAAFGIVTSLRLRPAVVDADVVAAARRAVELYLVSIDQYRRGELPALPITGHFLEAVSAGLRASAAAGVKRELKLDSLAVERHWQKPWGTHAYADVEVTIVDRAVAGNAPDQWETGKLRLTGDRQLRVTDAWDARGGRWFNGFAPLSLEEVRSQTAQAIGVYLRQESWVPGVVPEPWRAGDSSESTPFGQARSRRIDAIDRTRVVSRAFEDTVATVERFDTIEGLWTGLATVRIDGTIVTKDSAGTVIRVPFERRVKALLLHSWLPEVVDEEVLPGVWLSGGVLALEKIDVNRA